MKRTITLLMAVLAVLTICSCGTDYHYLSHSLPSENSDSAFHSASLKSMMGSPSQQSENAETIDRKIIKKGDVKFETEDVNRTKSSIVQAVQEQLGYISNDNVNDYSDRVEHKLVIRVPADRFDLLLQGISGSVDKFDSKDIEVLDVTEEYIDIQSRVKTKRGLQARYMELLKQATGVEEMLIIEKEIGNLQTEVESVEGRMRYLHDRIAFSTLTVTYYQKTESGAYQFAFFSEFKDGIITGWKLFLWFIVGLSYLWVFITLVVAAIYLLVRRKRQMKTFTNP